MNGRGAGPCVPAEADGPAGRPAGDRPRAGRGAAPRDRPPAGRLPAAGGALLLRGPHPRRGRQAAAMPGRHAPQPAGPGAREAPPRPGAPRRGPAAAALAAVLAPRSASASVSSPPVRFHDPGRDRASRPVTPPSGALSGLRRGPGPGGPPYHAVPQAQAHRDVPVAARGRRRRRRLFHAARWRWRMSPKGSPSAPARHPVAAKPDDTASDPAPGRMTVVGRVLDPQGKPVPNASVMVYGSTQAGRRTGQADDGTRDASARRPATDRAGSGSTRRAPRRRRITWSAPRPSRRATVWAGSTWTSTPISPPPTSRSGPSR